MTKFESFQEHCDIFFILASSFTESKDFYHPNYCLWRFEKVSLDNGDIAGFTQSRYNDKQLIDAPRHVIMLELESLFIKLLTSFEQIKGRFK
jgi:hypothetical protein